MQMQAYGKSALRVAKNYTRGYSDVQTKVRDATSNDAWGPSGTQMSEIAALTYNQSDFVEIMEMLDKRLNDKGKNWRHVFKSLTLLDYCLHAGSDNCVLYFRENLYIVKTLKEFQYLDETGKDQGANVRQKAKDITSLILDESRLQDQRKSRAHMRDRMNGDTGRPSRSSLDDDDRSRPAARPPTSAPPRRGEDGDMAAAIAASKLSAEDEAARSRRTGQGDREMEEAMRLSREEDERRRRDQAGQTDLSLFDDNQQNNLIDINGGQQLPMMTGMPFASFNPYAAQQQAQQEEWARQQQMAELQRQAEEMAFMQHQQLAQQQQQQQEEYMRQQQYQQQLLYQQQQMQQQPLVPQPTAYGSNNPFSAFAPPAATPPVPAPQPQLQPQATYTPPPQASPARQSAQPRLPKDDGKNAELARLLAAGGGLDTFGNIGSTRMPAQFTQRTGALNAQATGARPNPFGFADSFGTPQPKPAGQQQPTATGNPFFTI